MYACTFGWNNECYSEREREKVIWPYDRMLGIILVLRCVFTAATQGTSALHCSVATGLKYARCG